MQQVKKTSDDRWAYAGLIGVLLLALALRLLRPDAFGLGMPYYSSGAVNMLQSPAHFLFAVADAGGVTIDKTPLAFWLQALAIALFGKSGFAVGMVSIFAGMLSIAVLYRLVARDFGRAAGWFAALVFAMTPISIAVNRSNVPESVLILAMLLAAWGFLRAIRISSLLSLCAAAALLGIAFNVKMLQALLHAPALYAAYFWGARGTFRRKFSQLAAATLVLMVVSSPWLLLLQLTPPENRPYIGSTRENSPLELIFGYNGLLRLIGGSQYAALSGAAPIDTSRAAPSPEIGVPGALRFFQYEMGNETSWLLALALWGLCLTVVRTRFRLPLAAEHRAALLWGGWLLVGLLVFSMLQLLHAFHISILAPPIAALAAIGAVQIWQIVRTASARTRLLLPAILLSTLATQLLLLSYYPAPFKLPLVLLVVLALLVTLRIRLPHRQMQAALATLCIIPFAWGLATAAERTDILVPVAYHARQSEMLTSDLYIELTQGEYSIVDLVRRDERVRYDLVVSNQSIASRLPMQTDLRVLYLGGWSGNDPIYEPGEILAMLDAGQIGYVLRTQQHPEIMEMVALRCREARTLIAPYRDPATNALLGGLILYDCRD